MLKIRPRTARSGPMILIGRDLPAAAPLDGQRPDWQQASPAWIHKALQGVLAKPAGGWAVLDETRAIDTPRAYRVAGRDLVAWRAGGRLLVAPNACPHMGARLSEGRVCDGRLACPWHDLTLGPEGHGGWRPLPSYDDGVLAWVRLDELLGIDDPPTDAPRLATRPRRFIDAVVRKEARCEPRDVIQNRLDPWHGAHYHPHSFGSLHVIDQQADEITVRVAYRIAGPVAMEVDARFQCPDPRTIVMTIIAGDGTGSVVETHATAIDGGRTAIIEATLATSDRVGFGVARRATRLLRPLMKRVAGRLWEEDTAYAERLYELRQTNESHGATELRRRHGRLRRWDVPLLGSRA